MEVMASKEKPHEGWYIIRYISLLSKKEVSSLSYIDDMVHIHVPYYVYPHTWEELEVKYYEPINIEGLCRRLK